MNRGRSPFICAPVWYRSKFGAYTVPATITCTFETLHLGAVDDGYIPALTDALHVHLTVQSPGFPQRGPNSTVKTQAELFKEAKDLLAHSLAVWPFEKEGATADAIKQLLRECEQTPRDLPPGASSHNLAGTYQEWDVPYFDPGNRWLSCAPEGFDNPHQHLVQTPGTWAWPMER